MLVNVETLILSMFLCQLHTYPDSGPGWAPYGAYNGICGSHKKWSSQLAYGFSQRPMVARTNPARGPAGICTGIQGTANGQGPFDLAMGKPWAIPYGARTGLPLPGLAPVCPWCPVPIPYGISPGTLSGYFVLVHLQSCLRWFRGTGIGTKTLVSYMQKSALGT